MRLAYLGPLTMENIATAQRLGYDGLEADVGWLDRPRLAELERALPQLQEELRRTHLQVTAVAVYGNALGTPAAETIAHYQRAMRVAQQLGAGVVCGITGRDNALSLEDNLRLFAERFGPIADLAADADLRIALEPWPGRVTGYGQYRWTNLAISPLLYDRLFDLVPQPALGIEYDPSHYAWQGMDYLAIARDYQSRIHHCHAKDLLLDEALLRRGGVHAPGWFRFCLPGLGQVDWPLLFATLQQAGYRGDLAVEHEDEQFKNDRWEEGLGLALKTLRPFVDQYRISQGG